MSNIVQIKDKSLVRNSFSVQLVCFRSKQLFLRFYQGLLILLIYIGELGEYNKSSF